MTALIPRIYRWCTDVLSLGCEQNIYVQQRTNAHKQNTVRANTIAHMQVLYLMLMGEMPAETSAKIEATFTLTL